MPSAAVSGCADPPPAATEPLSARTVTRRARDTATGTDRWRSVSAASPAGRAVTRADDGCSTDARVAVRRGANVVAAHDVGCKLVASIKPHSLSRRCTGRTLMLSTGVGVVRVMGKKGGAKGDGAMASLDAARVGELLSVDVKKVTERRVQSLWAGFGAVSSLTATLAAGGEHALMVKRVDPPAVDATSVGDQRKLRSYLVECNFYERLADGLRDVGVTVAHPYLLEVRRV